MTREARRRNLKRLLHPRHVAVIGGNAAAEATRQLDRIGFEGPVWPVNPARAEIAGRPCFARVRDLPEPPDAAVLAVPARHCAQVQGELAAVGAGGSICFAAGFAETGEGALEADLAAACGETALVGPNCHGILNYLDGVALWPDEHGGERVARGAAFVSQSGNVAMNATFHRRSVPLAYVIGTGNQAVLDVGDYIDALLDDDRVDAIGLFIEGIKDVPGFAAAAWRALERGVPIVALKVGVSEEGARAVLSHTSALAGSDAVHDALFERLGVLRVETLAELLETLKLLSVAGPLPGRRVLSLSCSGGEAALMGDLGGRLGLRFPQVPEATAEKLAGQLAIPAATVGNPLDYNTHVWGDVQATAAAFETAMREDIDAAALVLDIPQEDRCAIANWRAAMEALIAAHQRTGTPAALVSLLAESLPEPLRRACIKAGVAPLQGLREGVTALVRAGQYGERRPALLAEGAWTGPGAQPGGGPARMLSEPAGKARLAAFGLACPSGCVTPPNPAEAAAAAAAIGFPVAVKAAGSALSHKTELDAVCLGLRDSNSVAEAVAAMLDRLDRAGIACDGVLVESLIEDSVAELIVGAVRDPVAGLALVVGNGGVLAELLRETRTLLLPTTAGRVRAALAELGAGRLLAGYRGRPAGDIEAAVSACLAVAAFAEAHADTLVELDVNPLLVRPAGRGAVAADALVRLRQAEAADVAAQ